MMHPDPAQHRAMACAGGDMPGAAEAEVRHPRRDRGPRPGRRILDREADRRIDAQPLRGGEIDVRVRLAAVPAVGAVDLLAEMMDEPEQSERPADYFGAARRRDRGAAGAQRTEEGRVGEEWWCTCRLRGERV